MSEPVFFLDGECPECGKFCGNGGSGPLKCKCGWVGGGPSDKLKAKIDELKAKIDEIFREEFGED